MKQTAVEWLVGELMEKDLLLVFGKPSLDNDAIKIIEQAKEMEKEQMIDWYATGQADTVNMYEQHLNKNSNTNE